MICFKDLNDKTETKGIYQNNGTQFEWVQAKQT